MGARNDTSFAQCGRTGLSGELQFAGQLDAGPRMTCAKLEGLARDSLRAPSERKWARRLKKLGQFFGRPSGRLWGFAC